MIAPGVAAGNYTEPAEVSQYPWSPCRGQKGVTAVDTIDGFVAAILDEPDEPAHRAGLIDWVTEHEPAGYVASVRQLRRFGQLKEQLQKLPSQRNVRTRWAKWDRAVKYIRERLTSNPEWWEWAILSGWMPIRHNGMPLIDHLDQASRRMVTMTELRICNLVDPRAFDAELDRARLRVNEAYSRFMATQARAARRVHAACAYAHRLGTSFAQPWYFVQSYGVGGAVHHLAVAVRGRRDNGWLCRLADMIAATPREG